MQRALRAVWRAAAGLTDAALASGAFKAKLPQAKFSGLEDKTPFDSFAQRDFHRLRRVSHLYAWFQGPLARRLFEHEGGSGGAQSNGTSTAPAASRFSDRATSVFSLVGRSALRRADAAGR